MNIPGFTAEKSTYKTIRRFRSETTRNISDGTKDNQVYMQKPNNANTPGGKCSGWMTGNVTISGHYDSLGRCCEDPSPYKVRACIDCDYPNHCSDRLVISNTFPFGTLGGVFARF
jgi:hypothetical protein